MLPTTRAKGLRKFMKYQKEDVSWINKLKEGGNIWSIRPRLHKSIE